MCLGSVVPIFMREASVKLNTSKTAWGFLWKRRKLCLCYHICWCLFVLYSKCQCMQHWKCLLDKGWWWHDNIYDGLSFNYICISIWRLSNSSAILWRNCYKIKKFYISDMEKVIFLCYHKQLGIKSIAVREQRWKIFLFSLIYAQEV